MPEDEQAVAVAQQPPCGACRTLRRRCVPGCVFAPYFSAEDFAAVHGVFGASNASKMLERVELPEQRRVAAATLIEEAKARARDPTFGRVSYLRILQEVNDKARAQVDEAREEIAREFGDLAASEPVDVAAASPAVKMEARAQVEAALKHAREQDARLLGVRKANEVRWRELHETGTGKHAGNGKGPPDVIKRHRGPSLSEQTMLIPRAAKQRRSSKPPGFPDELSHPHQQMAVAEAEREKALLMRQAAPAMQHDHHLAAQHGETTERPRVPEVSGHGQMHQKMSEASREEAMKSVQAPAAAPPQHLDSAGQHAGTEQPRHHAGDAAAGRTTMAQGSSSVLLEAMMQLAGAGDEKQQHLVAQHGVKEHGMAIGHGQPDWITQQMLRLHELLDMAELARKQKNDVMTEMGQWDAAAGVAGEPDVMTMMQQVPPNTWQHQDPATQYAGFLDGRPQEMMPPQQMEEASAAELAKTTGNMSQQFAWAQQYHDPAAVHHASPWHHQMAEVHQPASASQVASEQDMLVLLQQQHQVVAAAESLPAGSRQFDNLAAQYDDTELTLGYVHPDMQMHQQVVAAGQVAGVQDMNWRHAQNGLDISHPDGETQALLQKLAAILELAGKQATIREQDVMTMTQQDPEAAWLQHYLLEQTKKASMPDLAKRQELFANAEKERKLEMLMRQYAAAERAREQELFRKREMLMRQVAAAGRAREQEMIAQQAAAAQQQLHPAAQYSGSELDTSLGQGHPYWHQPTVQQMLQEQQLADAVGFAGHQHDMTLVQQDAAVHANGEHRGGGGAATMAFLSPGSTNDTPFLADQQPQPNGHQMDSSLPPLPPALGQLHAQASRQQRTDGGGQGLDSDLAAYLHYDSLSRHGHGNDRLQQG